MYSLNEIKNRNKLEILQYGSFTYFKNINYKSSLLVVIG